MSQNIKSAADLKLDEGGVGGDGSDDKTFFLLGLGFFSVLLCCEGCLLGCNDGKSRSGAGATFLPSLRSLVLGLGASLCQAGVCPLGYRYCGPKAWI